MTTKPNVPTAATLARLTQLRDYSDSLWRLAVDTCGDYRQKQCLACKDAAIIAWDRAIEAAKDGARTEAIKALWQAKSLAKEWGDNGYEEGEAIELLMVHWVDWIVGVSDVTQRLIHDTVRAVGGIEDKERLVAELVRVGGQIHAREAVE